MGSGGRGARARREGNGVRGVGAGAARQEDCLRVEREQEWERAAGDKRVRARRATLTEVEGRTRELLLLLVATGMEGGLCGDGKLLLIM